MCGECDHRSHLYFFRDVSIIKVLLIFIKKMNFKLERLRADLDLNLSEALKKAQRVLAEPIDMDQFSDYKDVGVDKQYVAEMEKKFTNDEARDTETEALFRKMAKVLEAIIFEQIEQSNWLGDTATTIQASRYDDIKHGVDTIVEFEEEDGRNASHLALAIDVTTSNELRRKFDRILGEIKSGTLTEIKYFLSESMGIRGRKFNVPRVVIGADKKTLFDLMDKWLEKDNKALAEHVIQAVIIEEILEQLKAFRIAAEHAKQDGVIAVYDKTIKIVENIKDEKNLSEDILLQADEDKVLQAIRDNLSWLSR